MKRILALTLTLITLLSLVACGGSSSDTSALGSGDQNNDMTDTNPPETEEVVIRDEKGAPLPSKLTLSKIDSKDYSSVLVYDGGYLYGKDGKIGICSFDGKTDTGAKYSFATGEEQYFIVSDQSGKADPANLATLNAYGLVDITGKELVPQKYASISVISDRYVKVCEVSAEQSSENEALVKLSKSNSLDGAEHFYKGKWYVYDLTTGKKVENVGTSKPTVPRIRGNVISYKNDNSTDVVVNENGTAIPSTANILSNGTYTLDGKVYDSAGNVLFTLKRDGFVPYTVVSEQDMYVASKYKDGKNHYAVMDMTGKLVSATFEDNIYVSGNIIECDDKLYSFKGEEIIAGKYDSIDYKSLCGIEIYMLEQDKELTILDGSFNTIYQGTLDDDMRAYNSYCTVTKTTGKTTTVLCYAQGEYSISANVCGFLLAYNGKSPDYRLIDLISGEALLTGARSYSVSVNAQGVFVAAKTAGGYDFYTLGR